MNLKDYQRGRNDGLALALKIVQEGGREALEAEIKNRGETGGKLIMNYNESKETVLQLLPAEEVILQFAEECVELSREILVFDVEADGRLLSNGTEYKMLSKVREEAADVELVADVLLDKIYAAYDRRILGSMVGSILIVVKGLGEGGAQAAARQKRGELHADYRGRGKGNASLSYLHDNGFGYHFIQK